MRFRRSPRSNGRLTDIVAGDFNEDAASGAVGNEARRAGFINVLASVGNREQTHPWLETYNRADKWGVIDHILVRNATPVFGDVLDAGILELTGETARIDATLATVGSDHYAIIARIDLPWPAVRA